MQLPQAPPAGVILSSEKISDFLNATRARLALGFTSKTLICSFVFLTNIFFYVKKKLPQTIKVKIAPGDTSSCF